MTARNMKSLIVTVLVMMVYIVTIATTATRVRATELTRAKTGPSQGRVAWCKSESSADSGVTTMGKNKTERAGFEPALQVYPVKQFSKLSPSATRPPLQGTPVVHYPRALSGASI